MFQLLQFFSCYLLYFTKLFRLLVVRPKTVGSNDVCLQCRTNTTRRQAVLGDRERRHVKSNTGNPSDGWLDQLLLHVFVGHTFGTICNACLVSLEATPNRSLAGCGPGGCDYISRSIQCQPLSSTLVVCNRFTVA